MIETEDGHLDVTLKKHEGRSRKKYYYFEASLSDGTDAIPSGLPVPSETEGQLVAPISEAIPSACHSRPAAMSEPGVPSAPPAGLDWL